MVWLYGATLLPYEAISDSPSCAAEAVWLKAPPSLELLSFSLSESALLRVEGRIAALGVALGESEGSSNATGEREDQRGQCV